MCETLVYYFVPALLIGCYYYFRKQSKTLEQTFFAAAFVILNIAILFWQSSRFLSRRHTLALVVFTIFYIPIGLHTVACWLSERSPKNNLGMQKNRPHWFFVLLVIGMAICLPKLLRPMRIDKQGYRDVANWLRESTAPKDMIAVPDRRIAFYAERKGLGYDKKVSKQAKYVVGIVKDGDQPPKFGRAIQARYSVWMNKKEMKKRIVIYEVL